MLVKRAIDNISHPGPSPVLDSVPRRIVESVRDFSPKADTPVYTGWSEIGGRFF